MKFLNSKSSIACLVLLQLSISYAYPISSRLTRNATSLRQDFQPEILSDFASTSRESALRNDEDIVINQEDESFAIENPTEQPILTGNPDMSIPFWDSTKIENQQQKQEDHSPISDDEESNPQSPIQQEDSSDERKKEAERLHKVVSVFHLNRVLGTSAPTPAFRRAFYGIPEPFERQRSLGFPNLITNTLDNFHHQLDWSRFSAFY